MTQERPIKELLQVMLDNQQEFSNGMCFWLINLYWLDYISRDELKTLQNYMRRNRPWWYFFRFDSYWWAKDDIEPRIRWIKEHIKKLNKVK